MARVVIVVGHPKKGETLNLALARAYQSGAEEAGHDVALFELSEMTFDPILHEGFSGEQPLEPPLADAQAAIGACDHLVFVFPLWFGFMPALMKGFIERVFQPGFAIGKKNGGSDWTPLLKGKSARLIMTMGMPALIYRVWFGAHAIKALKWNILRFCGFSPVAVTLHGMVEMVSSSTRQKWLRDAYKLGQTAK